MSKQTVRIKDIAQYVGVSASTVSAVLNQNGEQARISRETQEKVFKAAKELGYRKNISAKRLVEQHGSTPVIAIFWGAYATATNPLYFEYGMWSQFLCGTMAYMEDSGNRCELCVQPFRVGQLEKCGELIYNSLYNGIIFVGISEADERYIASIKIDVPFVIYNRSSTVFASAEVNHYACGEMAAQLLLRTGVKNPAILSTSEIRKSSSMRVVGFRDVCSKAGIPEGNIRSISCGIEPEQIYRAIDQLMDGDVRPDGLFVNSGDIIVESVRRLNARGIKIPKQLRLVVFGTNPINELLTPPITSVGAPVEKLAYDCMAMLLSSMQGQIKKGLTIIHEATYTCRESCPEV